MSANVVQRHICCRKRAQKPQQYLSLSIASGPELQGLAGVRKQYTSKLQWSPKTMELRLDVTRIAPGALKTLDYISKPNISVKAVKFHLEAPKELDLFVDIDTWIGSSPDP